MFRRELLAKNGCNFSKTKVLDSLELKFEIPIPIFFPQVSKTQDFPEFIRVCNYLPITHVRANRLGANCRKMETSFKQLF